MSTSTAAVTIKRLPSSEEIKAQRRADRDRKRTAKAAKLRKAIKQDRRDRTPLTPQEEAEVKVLKARLKNKHPSIYDDILAGLTRKEIAAKRGWDVRSVDNILYWFEHSHGSLKPSQQWRVYKNAV